MGEDELAPLALDANLLFVDAHAQVAREEIPDPVVVIAAHEMRVDSARAGARDRVEELEKAARHDGAILEVEIEDVTQKDEVGAGRNGVEEANEALAALGFAGQGPRAEVSVADNADVGGRYGFEGAR